MTAALAACAWTALVCLVLCVGGTVADRGLLDNLPGLKAPGEQDT